MLEAYGYKQKTINELNSINNDTNNFYNYKGLNFLSKLSSQNENLVIIFHGAVQGNDTNRIVFRGYNYEIDNTNIICISDYLLNIYPEYLVNWTLSTDKHNVEYIYDELFMHLITQQEYSKVIFTGTSAGGFPSLKFACKFNCIALISNSQIYLEEYTLFKRGRINVNDGKYGLLDILDKYNDEIIYKDKQIEIIIHEYKPKQIIIYNNKKDYTYNRDVVPFIQYINDNKLSHLFQINLFDYDKNPAPGESCHGIQFPDNKKHLYILQEFIKNN